MATMSAEAATLDGPLRTPIPFRGGGFQPGSNALLAILGLGAFLALWQLAFAMRWVNPVLLPGPIEVAAAVYDGLREGVYLEAIGTSLMRLLIGYGIAALMVAALVSL